jgi:hypothetical protein
MEIWKHIQDNYYISNYGRFKSIKSNGKEYITNGFKESRGYLRVTLNKKTIKIHRLVAKYFISNYCDTLTINHKDFNKENNHVGNLECISASDNILHYIQQNKKKYTSSKYLGVGFHKGINKWTTRVTINKKRFSLGVYDTEIEAIKAIEDWKQGKGSFNIGKGNTNKGKCKYSNDYKNKCVKLSYEIGIRKAGLLSKAGSTQISKWRKQFIKDNK